LLKRKSSANLPIDKKNNNFNSGQTGLNNSISAKMLMSSKTFQKLKPK
jgi:hypothetical protein